MKVIEEHTRRRKLNEHKRKKEIEERTCMPQSFGPLRLEHHSENVIRLVMNFG